MFKEISDIVSVHQREKVRGVSDSHGSVYEEYCPLNVMSCTDGR